MAAFSAADWTRGQDTAAATEGDKFAAIPLPSWVMGTGWISIIAFYFGSSVGSKEKNALLADVATRPALTPPSSR